MNKGRQRRYNLSETISNSEPSLSRDLNKSTSLDKKSTNAELSLYYLAKKMFSGLRCRRCYPKQVLGVTVDLESKMILPLASQ